MVMRKNHYEPPMNADKDKTKSRLRLVLSTFIGG
jgi:hypothetical protein